MTFMSPEAMIILSSDEEESEGIGGGSMNLGMWSIDDYLTFTCNCHRADTGAASDADAAPSYRIYEDETATPILTGTMALLDDSNTTGFYSERIQLTAANGFEVGKTYTIYIQATVNSVVGTTSHFFQVSALATSIATILSDLQNGGRLDLLIDAIKAKTDNLKANPAGVGDAMTLADDAITSAKFDESTAFPIKSADTGATLIARVGAAMTLADDAITAAKFDESTAFPVKSADTGATLIARVGAAMTLADDAITAAKFDESTAFPLKSADTGATAVARTGADSDTLETISDQLDTIDTNVDAVLDDTGTTGVLLNTNADLKKMGTQTIPTSNLFL